MARPSPGPGEEERALLASRPGLSSGDDSDDEEDDDEQELVGRGGVRRRRGMRAVLVAAAVGAVVIVLVVVGAVLLSRSPSDAEPTRAGQSVDVADVLENKFVAHGFNGSWASGPAAAGLAAPPERPGVSLREVVGGNFGASDDFNGTWVTGSEFLYRDEAGRALLYDVRTRTARQLVPPGLIPVASIKLELSADRRFLLAVHNYSKLFRHTYLAHYDIIDVEKKTRSPLEAPVHRGSDERVLQLVVWAPRGGALAYVHQNDIYYRPVADDPASQRRLTDDGSFSTVYHGVPDWVYEEEVLSSNTAMWFSPDGSHLAYATFNDSRTRIMTIPYYGPPTHLDYQYPRAISLRYPKSGTPNPTASLSVAQLSGEPRTVHLAPPDLFKEPILSAVAWAGPSEVAAVWMNRVQNRAQLLLCEPAAARCEAALSLREEAGWLDLFVPPLFSEDGRRMLFVHPQPLHGPGNGTADSAAVDAFRHVTLLERAPGSEANLTALTAGRFVVTEVTAWDQERGLVYFLATAEDDPTVLHLYSVPDNASGAPHAPSCLSCDLRSADAQPCLYNKASFSRDHSHYAHSCSGPGVPEVVLYNQRHERQVLWEANAEVRRLLQGRALPEVRRLQVPVPGGFKAQVQLLLPPGLDTSGRTKYPLLVNVYAGPDSYQVIQRYNVDWSTYLTVNRSVVYASIDGRGSGLKGNRMLFAGYRRLGSVEVDDQIEVTRFLQDNMPYIDRKRTGIWGWSYGGYSAAMALSRDRDGVFRCGISVAPVTDWAYYDTIYTERYMGLPTVSDNLEGYKRSELNTKLENFRNKLFFLVHGTLDDNVHYQQSMMLSKVLEHQDILFQQQSYPDEEHGLSNVRPHLYHSLEHFLSECFKRT